MVTNMRCNKNMHSPASDASSTVAVKCKNGFISIIKFVFCGAIILMHWDIPSSKHDCMFEGGYIYVDFFFMLQGFYLIKNWNYEKSGFDVAVSYLRDRVKKFFPCIFVASCLMFFLQISAVGEIRSFGKLIVEFLFQISFLSQVGSYISIGRGGIFWFLSSSVIIGSIIKGLSVKQGKWVIVLSTMVAFSCYNYFFATNGHMDTWHMTIFSGIVLTSLVRGFAGIAMGIFARAVTDDLRSISFRRWIYHTASIIATILSVVTLFLTEHVPHTKLDFYEIYIFVVILIFGELGFYGKSNRITDYLDSLCMPLYIFQVCCFLFLSSFVTPSVYSAALVVSIDLILSAIWVKISHKIRVTNIFINDGGK